MKGVDSEHILRAVGRRINFRQGVLVPEAVVSYVNGYHSATDLWPGYERPGYELRGQYLADLMWVTGSGYATEFEVKVSRADWRADLSKGKWGYMPPWLTRFIYVVPKALGIPDFVPPMAGVWHYAPTQWYHSEITVARAPRRIGATKVPREVLDVWLNHLHCRFWHQRLYVDRRLPREESIAA